MKTKLSVVLATRNEELNIGPCLESVKDIANEIIVVDESSSDRTREIAEEYGAKVYKVKHERIFHVNKQKSLELASGEWILQLDADERVSKDLGKEILETINKSNDELERLKVERLKNYLFKRHQSLIEQRDGSIGRQTGEVVAFFIPRVNYFLGKPLLHAGVYPDGVIRLVKIGKAKFPAKSVHEQIEIDGEVSWLSKNLEHHDSPTLKRYFKRLNRYTDLHAKDLRRKNTPKNLLYGFYFCFILSVLVFIKLYFRHKGFLDGPRGFLWSFLSAMHFPIAYFKYWIEREV